MALSPHQGHQSEIEITGANAARAIWAFTDRFFFPPGSKHSRLIGYGYYHDTHTRTTDGWKIQAMRFTRLWMEVE